MTAGPLGPARRGESNSAIQVREAREPCHMRSARTVGQSQPLAQFGVPVGADAWELPFVAVAAEADHARNVAVLVVKAMALDVAGNL